MHYLFYQFLDHLQRLASHRHILWTSYNQIAWVFDHWCRKKCLRILRHNDVIRSWCDLHSRQYRNTQAKGTCSMVYRLSNSRYQSPHRCFTSWRSRTRSQSFRCSIARLTIRPYVISEANRSSNLDSFVSATFASVYGLALQDLRHITSGKLARKLQTTHRWGSRIAGGATSLGELQDSSLGELARKLQAGLVRILGRRHRRMLWGSVEKYSLRRKVIKGPVGITWRKED